MDKQQKAAISRRDFIGSVAATTGTIALTGQLSPAQAASSVKGKAPARGRAARPGAIVATVNHISGIPLGGLGTGSIEIRPDGYFHDWLIFNQGSWAPRQPEHERGAGPEMDPSAFAFFLRTARAGEEPILRRLGVRAEENELYSRGWAKNVEAVSFDGAFPSATLEYLDDTLPVSITARFFSAMVPHDERTSGTPGFHGVFTVRNTSDKPVTVSLVGRLKNPLAWGADDRKLENTVTESGSTAYLTMRTTADMPKKATLGSLGMSVSGGKPMWITGEFPGYLGNGGWVWGPLGSSTPSFFNEFRSQGRLPSLAGTTSPAQLTNLSDDEIDALSSTEKKRQTDELLKYAAFDAIRLRLERVRPNLLATSDGHATFLKEARATLNTYAGDDRKRQDWGDAALGSSLTLAPGDEKEIRFTLGWYFPHHFSADGPEMGHRYEEWFADAEQVNRFLVEHADGHRTNAETFTDALFDTSLPEELAQAWSAQLSTLVKCTWWTRDGKFAVWEGLGCCGFHTTDITYQGSFNILALYPELQKAQMRMGAGFQREDGRVHHFFTPDLFHVDNGFDRVDMNPQFVMLAARDYLWTGDKEYLRALWPHVGRAMTNLDLLDSDHDGLPDRDTKRNTYDGWDFSGTPAYIASLWLGALQAAVRMATDLGETDQAARYKSVLDKASAAFDAKLWNGEYYSLLVDGDRRDDCCMSDQLSGQWFTSLSGLGHPLPDDHVVKALRAVAKHNYSPEHGLVNASYPVDGPAHFPTYGNGNATANWTGIEYAIASMMIDFGLVDEGTAVVDSIHDRYRRAGRIWNHVECGDHYYRAMSSWALLLASTGFKPDVPNGSLTIAPPKGLKGLRAPWFHSTAWGKLSGTGKRVDLNVVGGKLELRQLRLGVPAASAKVRRNGTTVAAVPTSENGLLTLAFAEPLTLSVGENLTVSLG